MKQTENLILKAALRVCIYCSVIVCAGLIIYLDGMWLAKPAQFGEVSFTEFGQLTMLLAAAGIFLKAGLIDTSSRGLSFILAGMAFLGAIRELDGFLDMIWHGSWKIPFYLVLCLVVWLVYRNRDTLQESIEDFLKQPAWGVLLSGFLVVFVFSRLFGKGELWKSIMADNYMRAVKNAVEEGTELMGFSLITLAAYEFLLLCRAKKRRDKQVR